MDKTYEQYYLNQAGSGLPYYAGAKFQRGHGFGSILSSLVRLVTPLARNVVKNVKPIAKALIPVVKPFARGAATEVGKESLGFLSDALKGKKVKQAAKNRAARARRRIASSLDRQVLQRGIGRRGARGRGRGRGKSRKTNIKRGQTVKSVRTLTGRRGSNIFS